MRPPYVSQAFQVVRTPLSAVILLATSLLYYWFPGIHPTGTFPTIFAQGEHAGTNWGRGAMTYAETPYARPPAKLTSNMLGSYDSEADHASARALSAALGGVY